MAQHDDDDVIGLEVSERLTDDDAALDLGARSGVVRLFAWVMSAVRR